MRRALMVLLLAGCPGAHDDYPTKACKTPADCFKGEICQLKSGSDNGTCVVETVAPDLATGDGGNP